VRVLLRAQSRLLRHPDLRPVVAHRRPVVRTDVVYGIAVLRARTTGLDWTRLEWRGGRRPVVGVVLAAPRRGAGARRARHHHRAHHDDAHLQHQRRPAQDLVPQEHRRLPGTIALVARRGMPQPEETGGRGC